MKRFFISIFNGAKKLLRSKGWDLVDFNKQYPFLRPVDPVGVEILADEAFNESCKEIHWLTLLDTPRLANLWDLSRMSNPKGDIIEIGSYKGGTSIHLSNANKDRKIIICDSFGESFENYKVELDHNFHLEQFKDNTDFVFERILKQKNRKYEIINGFFPGSVKNIETVKSVSFCYIDVDVYSSTLDTLTFLEENNCFLEKSIIVSDDYNRRADGVNKAIKEFTEKYPSWVAIPLFPSQCLLMHKSWFI